MKNFLLIKMHQVGDSNQRPHAYRLMDSNQQPDAYRLMAIRLLLTPVNEWWILQACKYKFSVF